MNVTTVTIPVKPATKAYILAHYSTIEPLEVRQYEHLGAILLMLADKPNYKFRKKEQEVGKEKLILALPTSLKHAVFHEKKRLMMGEVLNKFVVEQFLAHVTALICQGWSENKSVEDFMDRYQINPDQWEVDAARRLWRHYKEQKLKAASGWKEDVIFD